MYRWIGFGMILLGCSGLGAWYSSRFQKEYRDLQQLSRILELLEGSIRYGRNSLPECCVYLSERVEEPYGSIFLHIYEEINRNDGEGFGELCERILEKELHTSNVQRKDRERFIACFSKCGFAENTMQLRSIECEREELEKRVEALRVENPTKCRLALSLGTMSGLLLVILFL